MTTDSAKSPVPPPELTPAALRTAVESLAPARLPAFAQHLSEATTNALHVRSLAPVQAFVASWAVFVAIERCLVRAERLRVLERIVDAGEQDPAEAIEEICVIRAEAEAEAGLSTADPSLPVRPGRKPTTRDHTTHTSHT